MRPVIVVGTAPGSNGANGWRRDYRDAQELLRGIPHHVCGINHAPAMCMDHFDHWCSLDGRHLGDWILKRQLSGGDTDFQAHTRMTSTPDGILAYWARGAWRAGSSGLFAVWVMRRLGYERVVLAGIHLMGLATDHLNGVQPRASYAEYQRAWNSVAGELEPYVRSMGGWTSTRFGMPTREWLQT